MKTHTPNAILERVRALMPGVAVSVLVAVTAMFLSEHYGAPAMLMALLLGLSLNFLAEQGTRTVQGVEYAAKSILRIGVALLGARISAQMLSELGPAMIGIVIGGVIFTILFALWAARLFGRGWRLALLTGGSVAICGASAAMAIAAVLPKTDKSERNLAFTVLSVTLLSTVAMIAYPLLASWFHFDAVESGVFLGGTIHDVAQVVGAGFSISPEVGETATLVKLIRVSMLAPVVLIFSLSMRVGGLEDRAEGGKRPPLLPLFVVGFLFLAGLNTVGVIPPSVSDLFGTVSRWALLIAIAAVGIKTSILRMLDVGATAIALIIVETVVLGMFVVAGVHLFR